MLARQLQSEIQSNYNLLCDGGGSRTEGECPTQILSDGENEDKVEKVQPKKSEKLFKANLFTRHIQKVWNKVQEVGKPEQFTVYYNYCYSMYKFMVVGGYGTFQHLKSKHLVKLGIATSQMKLNTCMFS